MEGHDAMRERERERELKLWAQYFWFTVLWMAFWVLAVVLVFLLDFLLVVHVCS